MPSCVNAAAVNNIWDSVVSVKSTYMDRGSIPLSCTKSIKYKPRNGCVFHLWHVWYLCSQMFPLVGLHLNAKREKQEITPRLP